MSTGVSVVAALALGAAVGAGVSVATLGGADCMLPKDTLRPAGKGKRCSTIK